VHHGSSREGGSDYAALKQQGHRRMLHVHVMMCVCMCVCVRVFQYVCALTCVMRVCLYKYVAHVCVRVHLITCKCVYACAYVHVCLIMCAPLRACWLVCISVLRTCASVCVR
jgi:hypothetical protein